MNGRATDRRHVISGLAGLCASALLPSSWANPPSEAGSSAFWQRAREGGCILLMRHGVTVAGVGDPPNFRLNDCSTQRNLSETGREASRKLGKRFVAERIPLAAIYSSAWCRCRDTARLAFDPHYPAHQVWSALNSFFQGQGDRDQQTREVLQRAANWQGPANRVLVTHQVNITALTGTVPAMGEVFLTRFDPAQSDRLTLLERLGA